MTRFIDVHSLVRLVDETGVPQFLEAEWPTPCATTFCAGASSTRRRAWPAIRTSA
jgi:hypothetical protein